MIETTATGSVRSAGSGTGTGSDTELIFLAVSDSSDDSTSALRDGRPGRRLATGWIETTSTGSAGTGTGSDTEVVFLVVSDSSDDSTLTLSVLLRGDRPGRRLLAALLGSGSGKSDFLLVLGTCLREDRRGAKAERDTVGVEST